MTDANREDSFDDQLLSAYVDGELTEEQRAQVEQRLSNDPAARKLVDQLQSMSDSLRKLPRQKLDEDLREAVLRQAERSMLLGEQAGQPARLERQQREQASSRRWVWASLATAAALFLMFYQPNDDHDEPSLAKAQPRVGRALESSPELRAPAAGSLVSEDAQAEEQLAASSVASTDEAEQQGEDLGPAPLLLVHLTHNSPEDGSHQFDELLQSQGIELEQESGDALADTAIARSERVRAEELETSELDETTEVVLVEAPPEQMEQLLLACNADTKNWQSLQLEPEAGSGALVSQWQGLQRGAQATARFSNRNRTALSSESVATRAQGLKFDQDKQLIESKKEGYQPLLQRGRATRVDSDWRRDRAKLKAGQEGPEEHSQASQSERDHAEVELRQESQPVDQETIRVLFVLHAAPPSSDTKLKASNK